MATFRIGQRVRIARTKVSHDTLGKAATVMSSLTERPFLDLSGSPYRGHDLDIDGIGSVSPNGCTYCFEPWQLEPLIPGDLHQAADDEVFLTDLRRIVDGVVA